MDSILVKGNGPLNGEIAIAGAKNAALTLMPATLLTDEPLTLTNVPRLLDIKTTNELLSSLGTEVAIMQEGQIIVLDTNQITNHTAHYDIVRKMRASILVLGPMLARDGKAIVSLPGGCAIGARPVDLHLQGLEAMGATIELKEGYIHAVAKDGLKGATIDFSFASVGATENILMAATLAKGTTVINNAAREPEIVDLADCLRKMGAQISGDGSPTITIQGVEKLHGTTHPVVADRIELGTYMLAPVIAGGEVELLGGRINGVNVVTKPFPGFPTDLQAQMMAALCTANGTSVLEETIFENRFMHAPELIRMGAKIDVQGGTATVTGVDKLKGAPVMATDLRASVSLILAGLAASGETVVSRVYHLDRGYERLVRKLSSCGANIERITS